ncbi:very short patch repair endonuclease [Candidatus Nitrosopumilus sediminis]|uniref:DNA G/T mismatch repair endonuclease n=1 Tax=Candidatus Nitrosopumilus sediminis TaxID=1229909 RepID=K0BGK2_9ARCH|nr:DNA mismatch endonuclease Vsr [Candidatus Nitrosopumilus sediminis]AFS83381.1 DNA G/T mismatch repair endonuclease [Candidatus Nitrosopumilus sediminis]
MTDIFTPEKRSWVMSRIRGTNTKIDLKMKKILTDTGYRHEMYPKMYGNPDFVIRRKKIIIYCDGDFWHGYRYSKKKKLPKKFWREKIENNMRRDRKYSRRLRKEGWSVLRFWEHDIEKKTEKCKRRIISKYKSK